MNLKSLNVMASPSESYKALSLSSSISLNPSNIITSAGVSNLVTRVSGIFSSATLESTGLIQWFLILSLSSSVSLPEII